MCSSPYLVSLKFKISSAFFIKPIAFGSRRCNFYAQLTCEGFNGTTYDSLKEGCTGEIEEGADILRSWAQKDPPQGFHIRCAKRSHEATVRTTLTIFRQVQILPRCVVRIVCLEFREVFLLLQLFVLPLPPPPPSDLSIIVEWKAR